MSEQIPERQRTISRDELLYTVQAASQILSWATDHHGMIFAHETPGFDPRNPTEPAWLAHLHHAQEDLSMALAEILPISGREEAGALINIIAPFAAGLALTAASIDERQSQQPLPTLSTTRYATEPALSSAFTNLRARRRPSRQAPGLLLRDRSGSAGLVAAWATLQEPADRFLAGGGLATWWRVWLNVGFGWLG